MDRNGRLVTKHVKPSAGTESKLSLPAPALSSAPAISQARFEQREWVIDWNRKRPTYSGLSSLFEGRYCYGESKFQCSDMEAYDVLRASHGNNALVLLNGGIRSKEEAIEFYKKHDLEHLAEDNDEWVDKVIARDLPAHPVLHMAGAYGSKAYRDSPQSLDALEANCVRAIRDASPYYPTLPDLIMNGEVSLNDIKVIGATRVMKAGRKGPIANLLKAVHSGTADYDAEALKKVIVKYERIDSHRILDPLTMTDYYGAETMLKLRYYHRAADLDTSHLGLRKRQDRAKIITFNDDLYHYGGGVIAFSQDEAIMLCESGAKAYEAAQNMKSGMTPLQIAAIAQEVPASISTGWL